MSTARLVLEAIRWLLGFGLLWHLPRPPAVTAGDRTLRSGGPTPEPVVATVIIPARNEEDNLRRLLPTIVGTAAQVIVIDDESDDRTAEVAVASGVTLLSAGPRPEGWAGKPWACHAGVQHAEHDVLVFIDADVRAEPGGLARVVAAQADHGGLVSVQPWHQPERPYEHLSSLAGLISIMGVGAFTPLGRRIRPRGAFGPCLAIDRATYDAIGGHEAVKDQLIEDVAMAQRAPKVTLFGGRDVLRYRMYPDGIRAVVDGWTRNIGLGARATNPTVMGLVVLWLSGLIMAPLTWAAPWLYALYVVQLLWLYRPVGKFGILTALLFPIPLVFFLGVFIRSLIRTYVLGTVTWRGRTVPTR